MQVSILIHPGTQYKIGSYEVFHGDCKVKAEIPCCQPFTPELLGLKIGAAAHSISIVNAELNLLTELARCGSPLASVEKRKVVVDMEQNKVKAPPLLI